MHTLADCLSGHDRVTVVVDIVNLVVELSVAVDVVNVLVGVAVVVVGVVSVRVKDVAVVVVAVADVCVAVVAVAVVVVVVVGITAKVDTVSVAFSVSYPSGHASTTKLKSVPTGSSSKMRTTASAWAV